MPEQWGKKLGVIPGTQSEDGEPIRTEKKYTQSITGMYSFYSESHLCCQKQSQMQVSDKKNKLYSHSFWMKEEKRL